MCFPQAIPLALGVGMSAASYFMDRAAQNKAADRQRAVLAQMFGQNNAQYQQNRTLLNDEISRYSPQAYAADVSQKEGDIVSRFGEQYAAAQQAAPDKEHTGIVTPNYDRMVADFEVQRANEAMDRAKNYARVRAPSDVNFDARLRQQRLGETFGVASSGLAAQNELSGMEYGAITPNYSILSPILRGAGNAATMYGISKLPIWGDANPGAAWTRKPAGADLNSWLPSGAKPGSTSYWAPTYRGGGRW